MAVTERSAEGKIEILEDGQIQYRRDVVISRDGTEITRLYHRRTFFPGQDISDQSNRLRAIADVVWTPAVIAAYLAKLASNPL
jgi:hypothetical protein